MPLIDGFDVLEWARERGVSGRTVIAMMSTSVEAHDISRAFALGAHSYVAKAGKPAPLIELVRTASLFSSPAEAAASMPRWQLHFGNTSGPFA